MGTSNSNILIKNMLNYGNTGVTGGGLSFWNSSPIISKSTIFGNTATEGAGIYLHNCSSNIKDMIIWDNEPDQVFDDSGTNSIHYSIVEGGLAGTGNVNADPLFTNETWFDLNLTWPDYPIPDGLKSAAIDTGDPSSPLDPDGTRSDMGALPYEQTYTTIPGGNISGTLTCAESPYFVQGDIVLAAADQLIIEPCVAMIFQGYYRFEVRGRLLAEGTETEQITLASADTVEGWRGLRFINTKSNGQDSSILVNCRITFGNAHDSYSDYNRGGGIYVKSSGDLLVKNCLLNKNRAELSGGAVFSTGASGPLFLNNAFENNYSPTGGAFYGNSTGNLYLTNNIFQNNRANSGGALNAYSSNIYLAGNTIRNNRAEQFGGAIYYASGGNFFFNASNKNQVYLNYAGAAGLDFYYNGYQSSTTVMVDTFTVLYPNKHFAYPFNKFNFTIEEGVIEQVNSDLYVSMSGSDENSGTSEAEPLKTMYMACLKILADESNPRTVFLNEGTYSEGATGEVFPINWRSYVSLHGSDIDETNIYGEEKNQLLYCYNDSGFSIDSVNFQEDMVNMVEPSGLKIKARQVFPTLKCLAILLSKTEEVFTAITIATRT
ncbi:MAG: hypothetical protein R2764_10735 [Bacteroidales bacterium]